MIERFKRLLCIESILVKAHGGRRLYGALIGSSLGMLGWSESWCTIQSQSVRLGHKFVSFWHKWGDSRVEYSSGHIAYMVFLTNAFAVVLGACWGPQRPRVEATHCLVERVYRVARKTSLHLHLLDLCFGFEMVKEFRVCFNNCWFVSRWRFLQVVISVVHRWAIKVKCANLLRVSESMGLESNDCTVLLESDVLSDLFNLFILLHLVL